MRPRFCLSRSAADPSPLRSLPKQPLNAPRQQTASDKIPITSDAGPRHFSRAFLPWRFADAGPWRPPRHHHGAGIRKPSAAKDWLAAGEADLLPVPYFHVVFTLPAAIADIAYQNKTVIYDLLFK